MDSDTKKYLYKENTTAVRRSQDLKFDTLNNFIANGGLQINVKLLANNNT
jgi:hypothetical protein